MRVLQTGATCRAISLGQCRARLIQLPTSPFPLPGRRCITWRCGMQQQVNSWCFLHVGKKTTAGYISLTKPQQVSDETQKDILIPIHSSSTYPNKESHPPTNPALEAVPKRLPSPMWLKSNAITNLAHDLQSSDREIARAWLPRRFARPCSTLCPTRNSNPHGW